VEGPSEHGNEPSVKFLRLIKHHTIRTYEEVEV
jgi:hypothetical protein